MVNGLDKFGLCSSAFPGNCKVKQNIKSNFVDAKEFNVNDSSEQREDIASSDGQIKEKLNIKRTSAVRKPSTNMPRVSFLNKFETLSQHLANMEGEIEKIKETINKSSERQGEDIAGSSKNKLTIDERLQQIERFIEHIPPVRSQTALGATPSNFDCVQTHLDGVRNDVGKLIELTNLLVDEKNSILQRVSSISAELDILRQCKADKDEMAEALMDKADFNQIKVKALQVLDFFSFRKIA